MTGEKRPIICCGAFAFAGQCFLQHNHNQGSLFGASGIHKWCVHCSFLGSQVPTFTLGTKAIEPWSTFAVFENVLLFRAGKVAMRCQRGTQAPPGAIHLPHSPAGLSLCQESGNPRPSRETHSWRPAPPKTLHGTTRRWGRPSRSPRCRSTWSPPGGVG